MTSALANLQGQFVSNQNLIAAAAVIVAVPTLVVYLLLQRQFIAGLTLRSDEGLTMADQEASGPAMLPAQRQDRILAEIERVGGARITQLAELLGVSEMTVRRDIDALAPPGPDQEGVRRGDGHPRGARATSLDSRRSRTASWPRRTRSAPWRLP